jgi:hypothetical protein
MIERQAASACCAWQFDGAAGVSTAAFHAWKRKRKIRSRPAAGCNAPGARGPFIPVRVIAEAGVCGAFALTARAARS